MAVLLRACLIFCVFAYISATDAQSEDDSIVNSVDEALVDSLDESLEREKRGAYGCSRPCGRYSTCRNHSCVCNPGCYRKNGHCYPSGGGGGGSSDDSSGGNSNGGRYRRGGRRSGRYRRGGRRSGRRGGY